MGSAFELSTIAFAMIGDFERFTIAAITLSGTSACLS